MPTEPVDEGEHLLGPFYDVDEERTEIIPLGYEESAEPLEMCMGAYVVGSNESSIDGAPLKITNKDVTDFIQADWNRVFGPVPPARGFLLAYRAGAFAAGRVAEEIVLAKLLQPASLLGSPVEEILLFSEAQERGLVGLRQGSQSDDLILVLKDGRALIAESKAAFSGRSYLRRSVPKAKSQLQATLQRNPKLAGAVLCLINLSLRKVSITSVDRDALITNNNFLLEVFL